MSHIKRQIAGYIEHAQDQAYVVGVWPRTNAQQLAAAFPWYLEHDPFNLDDLLGELFWLRPRTIREPYLEASWGRRHVPRRTTER